MCVSPALFSLLLLLACARVCVCVRKLVLRVAAVSSCACVLGQSKSEGVVAVVVVIGAVVVVVIVVVAAAAFCLSDHATFDTEKCASGNG